MRVVILNDYGEINGGASNVAVTAALALAEHGVDVLFVNAVPLDAPLSDHPRLTTRCLGLQDVWSGRNHARRAVNAIWNSIAATRLKEILAPFEPASTVVHLHQWTRALSPSIIPLLGELRLPSVTTLHDFFLFCPNGLYFDHGRQACCERRPLSAPCILAGCDAVSRAHKAVRVVRQIVNERAWRSTPHPPAVVHVTETAMAVAAPFLPRQTRHFVVHNPVDIVQSACSAPSSNDLFVYLGRFTREKGPIVFARAAKRSGVRAAFCGAGSMQGEIRAANPEAVIAPWTDRAGVDALLDQARCLVFPSTWREPMGIVVVEALARGIPVICSTGTGAAEWIADGENGFLVEPGEGNALEERIGRLKDDVLVERLSRTAYERYWRDPLSPARHAEDLTRCYRALLGLSPTAPSRQAV